MGITQHESDIEMTPEADNTQPNAQSCPSPSLLESGVPEPDASWNQSLFQARLVTNRRLQCSEATPTTEGSSEDCFDTLSTIIEDDLTEDEGDTFTDSTSPVMTASSVSPVAQTPEEPSLPLLGAQLFIPPITVQGDCSHGFADCYLLDADTCASSFEDEASLPLLDPSIAIEGASSKGVLHPYDTDTTHQPGIDDHDSSASDSDTECSGFSSTIGVEDTLLESMEHKERLQTDHLGEIDTSGHVHAAVSDLTSDTNSCASDSEWNELDYGCSPRTELHRQTLQTPALCDIAISDTHTPMDAFDCLKEVGFLEDKSIGLSDLNAANISNPVAIHPHTDSDESLKLDDSLTLQWSDQDFSWEDSEDRTAASTLSSTKSHKHHCLASNVSLAGSPEQGTLFTRDCCVPDIADDWDVVEGDFDWD